MSAWDWVTLALPALGLLVAFLVTDYRERRRKRPLTGRAWLRDRADFYRRLR